MTPYFAGRTVAMPNQTTNANHDPIPEVPAVLPAGLPAGLGAGLTAGLPAGLPAETLAEPMTIRQMCAAFQVTPRTLRFYESKELISPVRDGARRLYGRRDRARLTLILRGKRFGFSLEEIRQLLGLYAMGDGQRTQLARTHELALIHLARMEAQRAELDDAITQLRSQIAWGAAELARRSGGSVAA